MMPKAKSASLLFAVVVVYYAFCLFPGSLGVGTAAAATGTVRVAIAQVTVTDGDLVGNLAKVESYVQKAGTAGAQIVVFPELVDVGFGAIVKASTGGANARPIPGATSDALGVIAVRYNVWIAAALLEEVPGGAYDTNVLIDNQGKVVLKQRKEFVYPYFGGTAVFEGNYHDAQVVDSPWGFIGMMDCADTAAFSKRQIFVTKKPTLMLVNFANPGSNYLANANTLATECNCSVAGTNMVFPSGTAGGTGGKSRFAAATGTTLWEGPIGVEAMKVWDLPINIPSNRAPSVDAGEVQTIRLPNKTLTLSGYVTDDGKPNGTLTTTWSKVSGPGTVTFGNSSAPSTGATFSTSGVYVLRLTANDGALTQTDDVDINVLPSTGDPNLVGYWTFDNTANDSSGKGNNGTIFGNPLYSTDVAPTGLANTRSLDLNGDDYVRVNHSASLNATATVTIAMWIKPRSYPGFAPTGNDWAELLSKGNTWGTQNYVLGFGAYYYLYADFLGMRVPSLDDAVRTPNQWYHVAAVLDANKKRGKIYINGVLDHAVFNFPTGTTNADPLYIGTGGENNLNVTKIDGKIDDVRLYTRALTDAEIAALVPAAAVNKPPQISAGPDQTIPASSPATLQGSYVDDDRRRPALPRNGRPGGRSADLGTLSSKTVIRWRRRRPSRSWVCMY